MLKKVFNGSGAHLAEMICYKILNLVIMAYHKGRRNAKKTFRIVIPKFTVAEKDQSLLNSCKKLALKLFIEIICKCVWESCSIKYLLYSLWNQLRFHESNNSTSFLVEKIISRAIHAVIFVDKWSQNWWNWDLCWKIKKTIFQNKQVFWKYAMWTLWQRWFRFILLGNQCQNPTCTEFNWLIFVVLSVQQIILKWRWKNHHFSSVYAFNKAGSK